MEACQHESKYQTPKNCKFNLSTLAIPTLVRAIKSPRAKLLTIHNIFNTYYYINKTLFKINNKFMIAIRMSKQSYKCMESNHDPT